MSSINNVSNTSTWNIQPNNQVSTAQGQGKVHHHHHHSKGNSKDAVTLNDTSKNSSSTSQQSVLDSLVSSGTITQDQENSIKSAFLSARQANGVSGSYGSKPTNPLSSLIANGTITENQADSVKEAFKSKFQSNENNNEVSAAKGHHKAHHHHQKQEVQSSTDIDVSTSTSAQNSDPLLQGSQDTESILNNILENNQQDPLTQTQDSNS